MLLSRALGLRKIGMKDDFRWRGTEISRIEGLSDAVFALAVTLLIVSLEVPKTYHDLLVSIRNFIPFAACFVQLMLVWYQHYLFHRQYNLQDFTSTLLSMVLLFLVLFYTYPLKFIFTCAFNSAGREAQSVGSYDNLSQLFTIYALGFIAVFSVFLLLYLHAYRHREELELTEVEIWDTKHSIREIALQIGVGCIALTLANVLSGELIGLSGISYALMGPALGFHGSWSGKQRKKLAVAL